MSHYLTSVRSERDSSGGSFAEVAADSPALRLFALLEVVASSDRPFSLQELAQDTGLPKPTLHRMLQQLEGAGLLQRGGDGRRYGTGPRLRRFAASLIRNDSHHGAHHAVLRRLVQEVGESCNITALSGDEVVYLDRVETAAPLRFTLQAGSRVPVHCSASGEVFLAQMTAERRRRLLGHAPLERCTANSLTDLGALEREMKKVRRDGFAVDDEEFLPGLLCVALHVPAAEAGTGPNLCVAVQAPVTRVPPARAKSFLPALQRAAQALADIDAEVAAPRGAASA